LLTKYLLAIAAVADLVIAALLIGVSGFWFDQDPESMHADTLALAAYAAALVACIAAPVVGLVFIRRGKSVRGLLVAWMPPAGALLALTIPA